MSVERGDAPRAPYQIRHQCPVAGCRAKGLSSNRLMCRKHWRMLPLALRESVYDAWNGGEPAPGYWAIHRIAIEAVDSRVRGGSEP